MVISTSVWSAQHPNAGRNIQHTLMCKNADKLSLFTQTLKFKDSVNVESTFKRSVNDEWSVELNKVWQKCENSFFLNLKNLKKQVRSEKD